MRIWVSRCLPSLLQCLVKLHGEGKALGVGETPVLTIVSVWASCGLLRGFGRRLLPARAGLTIATHGIVGRRLGLTITVRASAPDRLGSDGLNGSGRRVGLFVPGIGRQCDRGGCWLLPHFPLPDMLVDPIVRLEEPPLFSICQRSQAHPSIAMHRSGTEYARRRASIRLCAFAVKRALGLIVALK